MQLTRTRLVLALGTLVVLAAGAYAAWYLSSDAFRYRGLVTHDDTGMTAEQHTYAEQQLATAQAALAAQKEKSHDSKDWDWNLFLSIVDNASSLGDLVLARETLEEYVKLNTINPAAWSFYGDVLWRMEDYDQAEKAYRTAIDLSPSEEDYSALVATIRNTAPDGSREDEVKVILEEGVEKVGQTPYFMTELAKWYLAHADCERALDHYEVAKTLLPAGNEAILQDIAAAKEKCKK